MRTDDARCDDGDDAEAAARARPPTPEDLLLRSQLPLAYGDLDERDAAELRGLKRQIRERVGFFCEGYKEKCLRRRIGVRMRARGVHGYSDYGRLLDGDPAEYNRLIDTLTINVSKFFRNPEVWAVVRERVLPALVELPDPELRIWSAGTASGEEAYSAAMLVQECAAAHGWDVDRFRILGTDIDRESLSLARAGEYSDFAMTDTSESARERWFEALPSWRVRDSARRNVRFEELDLIRDSFPPEQHLIFCRNVIIYFERSVQEQLFRRFHEALLPGGYLVLGKVEALFGASASLFDTIASRQRVFRRA